MASAQGEVTLLLHRLRTGDRGAMEQLVTLVYTELHRMAAACMRRERADHTLQANALVHEAWGRLVEQREWNLENRAHFFGLASQLMRRILVDHARAVRAEKRGGDQIVVPLDDALAVAAEFPSQLLDVHRALEHLEKLDPERAGVAEMRFFGGLSIEEIAEIKGVSTRTVDRQWRAARAWLSRVLSGGSAPAIES